jgi:hypothetical protein
MAPSLLTRSKKKRKRSKTEPSSIEVAALYQQDLGNAGIKKKRRTVEPVMTMNAFNLPMTKAEKKKRTKRKVRISRVKHESRLVRFIVANPVLLYFYPSFACRLDLIARRTIITRSRQNPILYTLRFHLLGRKVRKRKNLQPIVSSGRIGNWKRVTFD